MPELYSDEYFMQEALKEARKANDADEVPIGCVIVSNNRIIARGHNQTELLTDVTAHAEILAITAASSYLSGKYLTECTMYVTLEPCAMCAGALMWSQVGKIVYGAGDPKKGFSVYGKNILHPKTQLQCGVLEEACSQLIVDFFRKKRNKF